MEVRKVETEKLIKANMEVRRVVKEVENGQNGG